jgi:hypothetical protein
VTGSSAATTSHRASRATWCTALSSIRTKWSCSSCKGWHSIRLRGPSSRVTLAWSHGTSTGCGCHHSVLLPIRALLGLPPLPDVTDWLRGRDHYWLSSIEPCLKCKNNVSEDEECPALSPAAPRYWRWSSPGSSSCASRARRKTRRCCAPRWGAVQAEVSCPIACESAAVSTLESEVVAKCDPWFPKFAFQMQLVPLHRGQDVPGQARGDVQHAAARAAPRRARRPHRGQGCHCTFHHVINVRQNTVQLMTASVLRVINLTPGE